MKVVWPRLVVALLLSCGPAHAATTAETDAFVARCSRAYAVLIGADDLAAAGRSGPRLRAFARRDRARETKAADILADWGRETQTADRADARTPSLDRLGPVFYPFDAVVLPFDVHGRRDAEADRATLARLGALEGRPFDALFIESDRRALEWLARAYDDYIRNGDDPALRRLSVSELPFVRALLVALPSR